MPSARRGLVSRTCGDLIEARHSLAPPAHRLAVSKETLARGRCWLELEAKCAQTLQTSAHWTSSGNRLAAACNMCRQEIDHILTALDGRFVPPGPSGAPTRGTADVLPTGRNFYSLDVRAIPTPTAWRVGCAAADALLRRHVERTGGYPESVALVIWGTSNMRTGGDDIAEVLALLGVRPRWDDDNRRVVGIELIPLAELGRPRIDVTVRISGLFRDAFPNLVRLLNDAVALVARLEEPLDRNFVRAHIARDTAAAVARATERCRSKRRRRGAAGLRIFGSKPGAYGAGLLPLIDGRNWQTRRRPGRRLPRPGAATPTPAGRGRRPRGARRLSPAAGADRRWSPRTRTTASTTSSTATTTSSSTAA